MRVLAITPLYPPGSRVGAWLATHLFLRDLVQRGHEVTAFSFREHGRIRELDGVRVETGRRGISYGNRLARMADVVVSHVGDGGRGAKAAGWAEVPNVQLVHGRLSSTGRASLVVFNAEWLQRTATLKCPSIVCHPPTDPADYRTDRGQHVTIVNCSRDKGIRTAWEAAQRLPGHRFLGVQGGYAEQTTPRLSNFDVIPTARDMRGQVYARTRILLMPSIYEAWGMVGVEAMCSGIPVIAHPAPGLLESLGSAGIFVDRNDYDGWAAEIRRLDDPDEYAAASARASARAAELDPQVSLDRFADAVLAAVAEALEPV